MDDRPYAGVFYDGTSNRKHRVEIRLSEQLDIVEDGSVIASWPYDDIRRADGHKLLRLSAVSALPLARLEIEDETAAQNVTARCTLLDEGNSGGQAWRIVGWSLAAACSIVLMTLYGIPFAADRLTPLVPTGFEKHLGDAVDKQIMALIGGDICTVRVDGTRALDKLVRTLNDMEGGAPQVDVQVMASDIPNAVTLPGGKIYVFSGLLQRANNADEIAGILAHEIGHAHNRDGLRNLIRTGGTSFLVGLLFGDITGSGAVIFASRSLLDASNSRETETAADDFAIAAMLRHGRSPVPMGEILVRLTSAKRYGTLLDSHPVSAQRLERMKQSAGPKPGEPLLSDIEWRSLKAICKPVYPGTTP